MTRVKVCCIANDEEARDAVAAGASAIGLVSAMPSGPGVISEEAIARIAATVPPPVATFLLTASVHPGEIIRQQSRCRVTAIQLVARQRPETYRALREALPGTRLVQVVHVTGSEAIAHAEAVAGAVDAVLLDTGDPSAPVPVLGGTGLTHDWTQSAAIRRRLSVPVFLAGGLRAENVSRAIQAVRPFAVDLCTGVRTDGRLDRAKLAAFMREVTAADAGG
jgi:phosphoribosylanthranilate isomerase